MVDMNALSDALARLGPFVVRAGVDYVMLETPEGESVDSIVLTPAGLVWGARDEYRAEFNDPVQAARAILLTQKDAT